MTRVSVSRIKKWRTCRRSHYYNYVMKIQKSYKDRPLALGSVVHDSLEELFKTGSYGESIRSFEKSLDGLFNEEKKDLEDIPQVVDEIIKGYIKTWENDDFEYLEVEVPYTLQITSNISLIVRIDAIIRSQDKIWIKETKTAKTMPDPIDRMLEDVQTFIYAYALRRHGYHIDGVVWDYIRSRAPSVPKLTTKGAMSRAKIDTTREVYLKALKDNSLDPQDYKDMLKGLTKARADYYNRFKHPLTKSMVRTTLADFIHTVNEIKRRPKAKERNPGMHCKWCQYRELCNADLLGINTEHILKTRYRPKTYEGKSK